MGLNSNSRPRQWYTREEKIRALTERVRLGGSLWSPGEQDRLLDETREAVAEEFGTLDPDDEFTLAQLHVAAGFWPSAGDPSPAGWQFTPKPPSRPF